MTDWLLLQMVIWGVPLLFVVNFLSCLALPVPASIMMMTAGAFVAAGDLDYWQLVIAAFGGAVAGDQVGFLIGRHGGHRLRSFFRKSPKRQALFDRAHDLTRKHGGVAVFLSRWLFSPLGPYANFAGGVIEMNRPKFTLWGSGGEAVWVFLYTGVGIVFSDQISTVASVASDLSGLLAAIAVALLFGWWLLKKWQETARHAKPAE